MPDWSGWVPAVDVAEYQPGCDYQTMAGHVHALWAKAGQGPNFRDPLYVRHRDGWIATGRPAGAYYFPEPDRQSATAAANRFAQITDGFAGCTLPAMLDVEDRPGADMVAALGPRGVADWVHTFCAWVADATGKTPIVYVGGWFGMATDPRLGAYVNWTPNYGSKTDYATLHGPDFRPGWTPRVHPAWQDIDVFQHSGGNGRVPGCPVPIDLDLISPAAWAQMTSHEEDPLMAIGDDILAKLGNVEKALAGQSARVDALEATLGGWEGDTRRQSPPYAVVADDDPHQWLVVAGEHGLRRIHIADQAQRQLLVTAHVIGDVPPISVDPAALAAIEVAG